MGKNIYGKILTRGGVSDAGVYGILLVPFYRKRNRSRGRQPMNKRWHLGFVEVDMLLCGGWRIGGRC